MERKTKEELETLLSALIEQVELFTIELQYEDAQTKFRETYEAWYEKRITLGVAIQAMMDNMKLCRDIGVWS